MQSPVVYITTLIFTTVMFCNQMITNTENLIHPTELFIKQTTQRDFCSIKAHTATGWTIRHSLMLLWFTDLMNVIEEVTILRLHSLNL